MQVTIQLNPSERIHFGSFHDDLNIFKICKSYITEDFKPFVLSSANLSEREQVQLDLLIDQMQDYWSQIQTQLKLFSI